MAIVRVVGPLIPPGGFCVKAEAVLEFDEVTADAGVGATLLRGWLEAHRVVVWGGGHKGAAADHDVPLLGRGEVREQKHHTRGCEQREFSQYIPLSVRLGLWNAATGLVAHLGSSRERLQEQNYPGYRSWLVPDDTKPAATRRSQSLVVADGVPDGRADAEYVVGAKNVGVILNVVVVNLGADKEMVPDVIAETGAEILHEVITGGVVDATGKVAARSGIRHVEACAGDADTAEKIETDLLAQLRLEERVEVGQDRTVGFVAEVTRLTSSLSSFNVEAEALLEANNIPANAEVSSTLLRDVSGKQLIRAGRGRQQSTAEKHDVALLGRSEAAREHKSKNRCEKR